MDRTVQRRAEKKEKECQKKNEEFFSVDGQEFIASLLAFFPPVHIEITEKFLSVNKDH